MKKELTLTQRKNRLIKTIREMKAEGFSKKFLRELKKQLREIREQIKEETFRLKNPDYKE